MHTSGVIMIEYSGYTFPHAFRFLINFNGKERLFNIMITDEQKGNIVRYVGICLENGLVSRSRKRDFSIAVSAMICEIIQSSIDISNYYETNYPNNDFEYAGTINDPKIKEIFNNIVQEKSSLAFYRELRERIEYGAYFYESKYRELAKNPFFLDILSDIRMNIFMRPITISEIKLIGRELNDKYRISKYITKVGEILSLSKYFEQSHWNEFCYALLNDKKIPIYT